MSGAAVFRAVYSALAVLIRREVAKSCRIRDRLNGGAALARLLRTRRGDALLR